MILLKTIPKSVLFLIKGGVYSALHTDMTTNEEYFHNVSSNTSSTQEDTCAIQYLVDKISVKMLFVLLYLIIFCLGFLGNILGKNQKVENVYSDILILGRLYKNKFLLTLCLSESFNTWIIWISYDLGFLSSRKVTNVTVLTFWFNYQS